MNILLETDLATVTGGAGAAAFSACWTLVTILEAIFPAFGVLLELCFAL